MSGELAWWVDCNSVWGSEGAGMGSVKDVECRTSPFISISASQTARVILRAEP